jgi:chemotaxis-related protein WspD
VKTGTATDLLNQSPPAGYLAACTGVVAEPVIEQSRVTESVFIFRIAAEWLALPTSVLQGVAGVEPVHWLPHRTNTIVLGVTNIGGELLVCVSLQGLLGLHLPSGASADRGRTAQRRFLVIADSGVRVVSPVEEVFGIHRFDPEEVTEVPATLARSAVRHTRALLRWNEHSVGLLDHRSILYALKAGVA